MVDTNTSSSWKRFWWLMMVSWKCNPTACLCEGYRWIVIRKGQWRWSSVFFITILNMPLNIKGSGRWFRRRDGNVVSLKCTISIPKAQNYVFGLRLVEFWCGYVLTGFATSITFYFTGIGAILRLPQCQRSNTEVQKVFVSYGFKLRVYPYQKGGGGHNAPRYEPTGISIGSTVRTCLRQQHPTDQT